MLRLLAIKLGERLRPARNLQPIPLIIPLLPLNNMKRVYEPRLRTRILLAFVQDIPMDQDQRPRLTLPQLILLIFSFPPGLILMLKTSRPPPFSLYLFKHRPLAISLPDKPLLTRRPSMTPRRKAQTPIPLRAILQRNPKPHRTRPIRIQKRAILMRRHRAANLRLLAYDHALQ